MIKSTEQRQITPYKWVHEERWWTRCCGVGPPLANTD